MTTELYLKDVTTLDSSREYTEEGYLVVPAKIARTGVQEYTPLELGKTDWSKSDTVKVYRPPDEVFHPQTMASFKNKPITNNHPPELVNSKNFKDFAVGYSSDEINRHGIYATAKLYITDEKTIDDIKSNRKVEVSNGYKSKIDWTKGVTEDGQEYDAIQREIRGNHIAIVERGRAGYNCKLEDSININKGNDMNKKVNVNGVDYEFNDQSANVVEKLKNDIEALKEKIKTSNDELKTKEDAFKAKEDEFKAKEDAFKAKEDEFKAKEDSSKEKLDSLDSLVNSKLQLIGDVKLIDSAIDFKGKTTIELQKEAIASKYPSVNLVDKSNDYICARFDAILETVKSVPSLLDSALSHQVSQKPVNVQGLTPSEMSRQKFIDSQKEQFKRGK